MTVQYAVIQYSCRPDDDSAVEVKYVTDNFDYANKLAFHHVKQMLPSKTYGCRTECRIVKNLSEPSSVYIKTIVDYRVCEVMYDDETDEYTFQEAWHNVWGVVKFNNKTDEKVEDIDETLIYEY